MIGVDYPPRDALACPYKGEPCREDDCEEYCVLDVIRSRWAEGPEDLR